jgi:hypothetical protein
MKKTLVGLFLVLWTLNCPALFSSGSGNNTNVLSADGGITQGAWVGSIGVATVTTTTNAVSDWHDMRNIGDKLACNGVTNTVTSRILTPSGKFWVYGFGGTFPTNSYVPLHTGTIESLEGATVTTFGTGPTKGPEIIQVISVSIVNFVHDASGDYFSVTGAGEFKVLRSNNLVDWVQMPTTYTAPTDITNLCTEQRQVFYKLLVTKQVVITNGNYIGFLDGKIRHGKTIITSIENGILWARNFNPVLGTNGCATWSGDSSSGMFVRIGGKVRLAGVVHGNNAEYPYRLQNGTPTFGIMKDQRGLTMLYPNGIDVQIEFPLDGGPYPTESCFTPFGSDDVQWLKANGFAK